MISKALRLGRHIGAQSLLFFLMVGCSFAQSQQIAIPVGIKGVKINLQLQTSFDSDGTFELTLESKFGTLRAHLWDDWGPAQRANFYITESGELAVIGGAVSVSLFEFPDNAPPREIPIYQHGGDPDKWRYVGATDQVDEIIQFQSASAWPECVPNYGDETSSYRRQYQVRSDCDLSL